MFHFFASKGGQKRLNAHPSLAKQISLLCIIYIQNYIAIINSTTTTTTSPSV